ncbi:MAG: type II secretion system F family protein [Thermodesulfobacteriota bacterium]
MGLTPAESAIFCLGAGLIVLFLFRTALPGISRRFASASSRHSDDLREEFIFLPPARIASGMLLSGFLCGIVALAMSGSPTAAAVSVAAPVLLAGTIVGWYRSRRRKTILSQLPVMLDLVAGHLKAGHSLVESLAETVPLLPRGIREEMAWLLQQNRLGTPLAEAFTLWERRIPSEDVSLFVRPLRAALPGGGNIVDLLERTVDILRRRIRTREKLRSMTAQARLQAIVLTLLPPSFAAVMSWIDPHFLHGLIGTPQGKAILSAAAVLQALGWLTIRKIVSVRP